MANQDNKIIDENVKLDTDKDVLDIKKILPKRKSYKVLVLSSFLQQLKEDKLYFICFVITIFAFVVFSTNKVKEAEGAFTNNDNNTTKEVNVKLDDKLDVTSYVGYYVKSYKLNKSFKYGNSCEVSSYDLVYEIKKDNSINRYIVNECLGTVLITSDTLGYVKGENTRNIGTKSHIYVFKDSKLTELDGLTYTKSNKYKMSSDVKDINNTALRFIEDKFIVHNSNELYLVNGKIIETEIITNNLLAKSIFRSGNTNNYKYISYNDGETEVCYEPYLVAAVDFEDKEAYTIYELEFDEENLTFKDPVVNFVRKRSDTCDTLNDDLTRLSS